MDTANNPHKPSADEIPIVCTPGALTIAQRERYMAVRARLDGFRRGLDDLPDGVGLRFSAEAKSVLVLAEFITLERLCCPFLRFSLEVRPGADEVRLLLTGREGVRHFLRAELGLD